MFKKNYGILMFRFIQFTVMNFEFANVISRIDMKISKSGMMWYNSQL